MGEFKQEENKQSDGLTPIIVKHLREEEFVKMYSIFDEGKQLEYANKIINKNGYRTVATVRTKGSLPFMQNRAYKLTNNAHVEWYDVGKDFSVVAPSEEAKKGCRSTSMGDVIEIDGKNYVVALSGFKLLEEL